MQNKNATYQIMGKLSGMVAALMLVLAMAFLSSCRNNNDFFTSKNSLKYSADTVWFDTVFTRVPGSTYPISVTQIFSIKNPEKLPVNANFQLGGGANSAYRMSIDGISGTQINDIEIGASDSVFVFVQCKLEANNNTQPLLVMDSIISSVGGHRSNVKLAAYGWDAHYFRDTIFESNITLSDNQKPTVILGYMGVDQGATLTIKPGVQLFASAQTKIYIAGTLDIQGTAAQRVSIRGDKPVWDPQFLPNQWGGIHILVGSVNNSIQFADITNATIGVRVDSLPVNGSTGLKISNTRIQYSGQASLAGITADIQATNCLFADAGSYSFLALLGGNYAFNHCTFSEYSGFSSRTDGHFAATNTLRDGNGKLLNHAPLNLSVYNCIVDGPLKEELQFDQTTLNVFNIRLENNMLKSLNPKSIITYPNFFNKTTGFVDVQRGNYQIDSTAFGYKKAGTFGTPVTIDLLGKTRKSQPDLGCYEKLP
jgi:hypothetical protein